MKKSVKAVLLSAFVFPGLGHMYLKRPWVGVILAGISVVAIYYLVSQTIEKALQIVEKIQTGEVPLDAQAITAMVTQQSTSADVQLGNIATAAFIICWLIGIIDSYRIASRQNNSDRNLFGKL